MRFVWRLLVVAAVSVGAHTGCRAPSVSIEQTPFVCLVPSDCAEGWRCLGGQCRAADDPYDAGALLPDERPRDAGMWGTVRVWLQSNDVRSYDGGGSWRDLSDAGNHFDFTGVVPGFNGTMPTLTPQGFVRFTDGVAGILSNARGLDFQGGAKRGSVEVVGFYDSPTSNGAFVYSSRFVVANPSEKGFMLCGSFDDGYQCQVMVSCGTPPEFYGNPVSQSLRPVSGAAHFVLVFDGPAVRLYRDGALINELTWSNEVEISTGTIDASTWYVGGPVAGGGSSLTGVNLGLVRYFHRALTPTEVEEARADARRRLSF